MVIYSQKQIEDLEIFQKRLEIIVGARLRADDRVDKAVFTQDRLRLKIKDWNGTQEIRKWREKRP